MKDNNFEYLKEIKNLIGIEIIRIKDADSARYFYINDKNELEYKDLIEFLDFSKLKSKFTEFCSEELNMVKVNYLFLYKLIKYGSIEINDFRFEGWFIKKEYLDKIKFYTDGSNTIMSLMNFKLETFCNIEKINENVNELLYFLAKSKIEKIGLINRLTRNPIIGNDESLTINIKCLKNDLSTIKEFLSDDLKLALEVENL